MQKHTKTNHSLSNKRDKRSPFPSHLVHGVPMVPSNSSVYKGLQGWFAIPYCSPEAPMAFIGLIGPLCCGQFTGSLARSEVDGFEDLLEPLGKSPGRSTWENTWKNHRNFRVESLALKVNQSYFLGQTLYDLTWLDLCRWDSLNSGRFITLSWQVIRLPGKILRTWNINKKGELQKTINHIQTIN